MKSQIERDFSRLYDHNAPDVYQLIIMGYTVTYSAC
jgi:hypothetical protein